MRNRIKKAFTMAEILLVMGIIGITAALTIPNIHGNADDKVAVGKVKKTYSELSTAVERAEAKYGNIRDWDSGTLYDRFSEFLNVNKICSSTDISQCWYNTNVTSGMKLKDGASLTMDIGQASSSSPKYLSITFDIDGPNAGDNTFGKDVFRSHVPLIVGFTKYGLMPFFRGDAGTEDVDMVSNSTPNEYNYLHWILQYDNMDYNNCRDQARWVTSPTCK